jgi:hypothetical protein
MPHSDNRTSALPSILRVAVLIVVQTEHSGFQNKGSSWEVWQDNCSQALRGSARFCPFRIPLVSNSLDYKKSLLADKLRTPIGGLGNFSFLCLEASVYGMKSSLREMSPLHCFSPLDEHVAKR